MFHVLTLTYLQPPDVIAETRPAHNEWVEAHFDAGHLILAGRQESGSGGILITGDISVEEADAMTATATRTTGRAGALRPDELQRHVPRTASLT